LKTSENAPGQERAEGAEGTNGTPERRERRSRDRYGRDRRERNANNDNVSSDTAPTAAAADGFANEEAPVASRSYFDRGSNTASTEAAPAAQAAPATTVAEPVKAPASQSSGTASTPAPAAQTAAAQGMPKVQSYALPMDALIQVAESSGLQWVNSDPAKIAQVQAAIAAEPKPVHVPRERPPVVVLDEGPLVLVETRKDLSEMKLPF
jgi:ribonuclease E